MNHSEDYRPKLRIKLRATTARDKGAFTFTELLVVMGVLAILGIIIFPAFAGVQNKGGRLQCANNLRQIWQDSMIFAGENNGWLPWCTLGSANGEGTETNHLGGVHYTHYVYFEGTPGTQITTNEPPITGGGYQNLGYLYQAGLAGNGSIFYCPAMWGIAGGANTYSPLLTTDSSGTILSTYFYNPRMANPMTANPIRRYQKVSNLEPHRLFAVDEIFPSNDGELGGEEAGLNPNTVEHARDHGWNVLFTDGSVQFSTLSANTNYDYTLVTRNLTEAESPESWLGYDQLFTFLEQDH
jgi:type II secretory pathway pseudopilin PulG